MLGQFQKSSLRIEVAATPAVILQSLTQVQGLKQWLVGSSFDSQMPAQLQVSDRFTTQIGPIHITHQVKHLTDSGLSLLLNEGIDGFHEWSWGDGWLQSRLEGITLLPLNLGHTINLWRLQQYLAQVSAKSNTPDKTA